MKKTVLLVLTIFVFALFAFKTVLIAPGIVGRAWDWGVPTFAEQFMIQAKASLFIWDDRLYGGFFFPTRIELPYWFLTLPFSLFGGEFFSKIIPLLILVLAGLSMIVAARKIFAMDYSLALMAAILYMLSPFAYSRLIGGHLTVLLGYALLPFVLWLSLSLFGDEKKEGLKSWLLVLISLTLTLSLGVLHPILLFVSWGLITLVAIVSFIVGKGRRKSIIGKFFLTWVLWTLLSVYWLLPIFFQMISGLGQLAIRPWQSVTEEMGFRLPYLALQSRPLSELFSFSFPFGLHTEFVYPIPSLIKPLFIFASIVVFAAGFAAAYLAYRSRKPYTSIIFLLTFIELVGFALVGGEKTIVGRMIFVLLINVVPYIFSVFSNPLRFLPLVILPFSILPSVTLLLLDEKLSKIGKIAIRGIAVATLLVFLYPWLFGSLTQPVFKEVSQPMSLRVTKTNKEDKKVFDYLKGFKEDVRWVHLPPPFVSWPGETDLSYIWNSIYSPKPLFVEYSQPILSGEIVKNLYSQTTSEDLSKLLGLGAVKKIIYPHYQRFAETYQEFIKNTVDYKPIVDNNWSQQRGIKKETTLFTTVDLYENENFVPHIFIPTQTTFIEGEKSLLTEIITFPDYQLRNAIFSADEKVAARTKLAQEKAEIIYIKPSYIGGGIFPQIKSEELYPAIRLLPTSPLHALVRLKEERLWQAVKDYPELRVSAALVLMAKRVNELKVMVEIDESGNEEQEKTAQRYLDLLNDFSQQFEGLTARGEIDNDLLIKAGVFLDDHNKNFNYIVGQSKNAYVINKIREIFGKINLIFPKVKENIWVTEREEEKKYILTISEGGSYSLFASPEAGRKLDFEIDGQPFSREDQSVGDKWLSLGKVDLGEGNHQLKVILPKQPNLFPGLATSSAVKRSSVLKEAEHSYQLFAQKENIIVGTNLSGLNDQKQYKISFKYRAVGNPLRITLEQPNDAEVGGLPKHRIDSFLAMEDKWQLVSAVFAPNFGSHEADLKFYLIADQNETDTYYLEDIRVEKVLSPSLLFKKEKEYQEQSLPKITFKKINPTKYLVKVEGATEPYFLVFSEAFHEGWQAYLTDAQGNDGQPIASYFNGEIKEEEHGKKFFDTSVFSNVLREPLPKEKHLLVNAFANAWYLDRTGDYLVTLEFIPQRVYFLGIWISLGAFMLALGALSALFLKRK